MVGRDARTGRGNKARTREASTCTFVLIAHADTGLRHRESCRLVQEGTKGRAAGAMVLRWARREDKKASRASRHEWAMRYPLNPYKSNTRPNQAVR